MEETLSMLPNELLEVILMDLSQRDILLNQRVCKRWHRIITGSTCLQRLLFLMPDEEASLQSNPILEKNFPTFFPLAQSDIQTLVDIFPWLYYDHDNRNDFFKDTNVDRDPVASSGTIERKRAMVNIKKRDAFLRKEASWRRMITHQPPVNVLKTYHNNSGENECPLCIAEKPLITGSNRRRNVQICPSTSIWTGHTDLPAFDTACFIWAANHPNGLTMDELFALALRPYVEDWKAIMVSLIHSRKEIGHLLNSLGRRTTLDFTSSEQPWDCGKPVSYLFLFTQTRKQVWKGDGWEEEQRKRRADLFDALGVDYCKDPYDIKHNISN